MIQTIDINTDKFGYLVVEFSYEYNQYDNYFEMIAIEEVRFWECDEVTEYDKLPNEVQADIDHKISEFLIFDANLGDYYDRYDLELEMM